MADVRGAEAVVVAGLGPTAWCVRHLLAARCSRRLELWGVNDFDAIAAPDVLVVADHEAHFDERRRRTIRTTQAARIRMWPSWGWSAGDERLQRMTEPVRSRLTSIAVALDLLLGEEPAGRTVALVGLDLFGHPLEGAAEDVAWELAGGLDALAGRGWSPLLLYLPRVLPVTAVQRLGERFQKARADDWLAGFRRPVGP